MLIWLVIVGGLAIMLTIYIIYKSYKSEYRKDSTKELIRFYELKILQARAELRNNKDGAEEKLSYYENNLKKIKEL